MEVPLKKKNDQGAWHRLEKKMNKVDKGVSLKKYAKRELNSRPKETWVPKGESALEKRELCFD